MKYEAATNQVAEQGAKLSKRGQEKMLLDLAIGETFCTMILFIIVVILSPSAFLFFFTVEDVKKLRDCCKGIKSLCRNFNMVNELNLVVSQLAAENKMIGNSAVRKKANETLATIQRIADEFSALDSAPVGGWKG